MCMPWRVHSCLPGPYASNSFTLKSAHEMVKAIGGLLRWPLGCQVRHALFCGQGVDCSMMQLLPAAARVLPWMALDGLVLGGCHWQHVLLASDVSVLLAGRYKRRHPMCPKSCSCNWARGAMNVTVSC
jgi:hypothetical protein